PIARINYSPPVFAVRNEAPWKSMREALDYMKKNPGKFNFANSGTWGAADFPMRMTAKATGVEYNNIPFDGGGPATLAVLGGHAAGGRRRRQRRRHVFVHGPAHAPGDGGQAAAAGGDRPLPHSRAAPDADAQRRGRRRGLHDVARRRRAERDAAGRRGQARERVQEDRRGQAVPGADPPAG